MAGALKQNFIEAVRLTPEGIQEFLTTPIPDPPSITTPADVDAAIVANGIAAKYICDLLGAFAGLTPIELLLRIGQHNNVLESAMLAGLEYIEGADSDENDIEVLEPQNGVSYTPGEMRFQAKAINGVCVGMTLALNGGDPIDMIEEDDAWTQYINMEIGEATTIFSAMFEDETTQTETISFTIAEYDPENPPDPPLPPEEQPKPPGGTSDDALQRAFERVRSAYRNVIKAVYEDLGGQSINELEYAVDVFLEVCQGSSSFITTLIADINSVLQELLAAAADEDEELIIYTSSSLMDKVNTLYTGITR